MITPASAPWTVRGRADGIFQRRRIFRGGQGGAKPQRLAPGLCAARGKRAVGQTDITEDLKGFIAAQTSVFLATASADGQPYIQHRGGPPGFLRVIDSQTIGFVDFSGNRQYITTGNLAENPKAQLFLIDYAQRRRIKIWGTAQGRRGRCRSGRATDARRLQGARPNR